MEARRFGEQKYGHVLSPEELWQKWTTETGFSEKEDFLALCDAAQLRYDPDLPYHNFNHALLILDLSLEIAARRERKGQPINRKALTLGAITHDALHNVRDHDFTTQEKLSSEVMKVIVDESGLRHRGVITRNDIDNAAEMIMTARDGAIPTTPEAGILLYADMDNVGSSYDYFLKCSKFLEKEAVQERGSPLVGSELDSYRDISLATLARLVDTVIRYADPEVRWMRDATYNLSKAVVSEAQRRKMLPSKLIQNIGEVALEINTMSSLLDEDTIS